MNFLILLNIVFVSGFHFNYNGNGFNHKLKIIDNQMKKLLIAKNKILKNITGLNFYNNTNPEEYFYSENDYENDNEFNNEYDYEFKPRPKKNNYNIIITTNTNTNSNTEINKNPEINSKIKSENFELIVNSKYNFENIGGYDIVKAELMQCADMLVNYTKYINYSVRIPKGIILEGPPGNGKTLMAKCFSGEINIGFIPVSGSQFQEKYVGIGAARIRELFELAKNNIPCIIFIDELDAVGRKRSSDSNSNNEHDSTLNELLVNLDGFKSDNGIFVIGATNRIDLLDSALIRPGRIDKTIYIGNPNKKTREEIIKIHLTGKPIKNISIDYLVELTNGFSGAQIENLFNEAMLYVLRNNKYIIEVDDIHLIANRILVGMQITKNELSDIVLYQVAIHEIGHALTGIITKHKKLIKVTINLWSPKSLGFTLFDIDEQNSNLITKEQLINEMMVLFGGRVAEEIIFNNNNISSGASHDLDQVKKIAKNMIINLGMGNKVIINDEDEINKEIDNIISIAYNRTIILLTDVKLLVEDCAKLLVKNYELTPNTILELITTKYKYNIHI